MSGFITNNIEARKKAKSKSEGNVFKLLSNATYGKFLFDPAKRLEDIHIDNSKFSFLKNIRTPMFKRCIILNENRAITVTKKKSVLMASPQFIGMTILDKAKYKLYDFYYNVLKKFYGDGCSLIYSDTDSYILEIITENPYEDFANRELAPYFDMSNFDRTDPLYSGEREKQLGCLSSEVGGKMIEEIIALAPKSYSLKIKDERDSMVGTKGICRAERNKLRHNDFKEIYLNDKTHTFDQYSILNHRGKMSTVKYTNRSGLTLYDDKRYWVGKNKSHGYGYFDTTDEDDERSDYEDSICSEDTDSDSDSDSNESFFDETSSETSEDDSPEDRKEEEEERKNKEKHSFWREREGYFLEKLSHM